MNREHPYNPYRISVSGSQKKSNTHNLIAVKILHASTQPGNFLRGGQIRTISLTERTGFILFELTFSSFVPSLSKNLFTLISHRSITSVNEFHCQAIINSTRTIVLFFFPVNIELCLLLCHTRKFCS